MKDREVKEMLFHQYILVNDHHLHQIEIDFHHQPKRKEKEILSFFFRG